MSLQISSRLKIIASYVSPYRHLIDVGTDHCLVPIHLMLNHDIDSAIATDVKEGPLNEANKNINLYNLTHKIDTRLGNGLELINIKDNCDTIIVAGMGGKLITDILDTGQHIMHLNKRLILQPNVFEESVRLWLCENHYEIVYEEIIKEDNIFYEIIVSDKVNQKIKYTNDEIKFGPLLLKAKNDLFIEKWQNILKYKKETHRKIPIGKENKKLFLNDIIRIESILNIVK